MGDKTPIEWTDATWNPTIGCTKISAGCKNCYFMTMHERRHRAWLGGTWPDAPRQYHVPATVLQLMPDRLDQPLRWAKPRRIFVNSLSDLFHEDIPEAFIDSVFGIMILARRHTFQILTKRPERMRRYILRLEGVVKEAGGEWPLPNVWLGTSVEDQAAANLRIPELLATPAAVRFLSCEPLLGGLYLDPWLPPKITAGGLSAEMLEIRETTEAIAADLRKREAETGLLHWVIAGGESGPGVRPMHPDWARALRDQCATAGVPFFFKQWGEWAPHDQPPIRGEYNGAGVFLKPNGRFGMQLDWWDGNAAAMNKVGKKKAGRVLDGRTHDGMPDGDRRILTQRRVGAKGGF